MKSLSLKSVKSVAANLAIALTLAWSTSFAGVYQSDAYAVSGETEADDVPMLAIGPVSSISAEDQAISVNGQTFSIDSITEFDGTTLSELSQGDYVAVGGELMDAGQSLATVVLALDESYAAGSSVSYLRVISGDNNSSLASFSSGESVVDYSGAVAQAGLGGLETGSEVELFGSSYGDLFVANDATILGSAYETNRIRGSGGRRIRGSGGRRIRGSGGRRIRGSGGRDLEAAATQRIRGSGGRRIRGSGGRRIRGSGGRRIRGSGGRRIRGSGGRDFRRGSNTTYPR